MSKMPGKKKKYSARFPPARIKKIMQTDEEVGKVAAAVPFIISRALELFAELLLNQANEVTMRRGARTLTPSHLKFCIENEGKFDFLREMVSTIPDLQDDDMEIEGEVLPAVQSSKPRSKTTTENGKSENHETVFKEPWHQNKESEHDNNLILTTPQDEDVSVSSTNYSAAPPSKLSPAVSSRGPSHPQLTRGGVPVKRRGRPPKVNGSLGRGYPPKPGEKRKHSEDFNYGEKRKVPDFHGCDDISISREKKKETQEEESVDDSNDVVCIDGGTSLIKTVFSAEGSPSSQNPLTTRLLQRGGFGGASFLRKLHPKNSRTGTSSLPASPLISKDQMTGSNNESSFQMPLKSLPAEASSSVNHVLPAFSTKSSSLTSHHSSSYEDRTEKTSSLITAKSAGLSRSNSTPGIVFSMSPLTKEISPATGSSPLVTSSPSTSRPSFTINMPADIVNMASSAETEASTSYSTLKKHSVPSNLKGVGGQRPHNEPDLRGRLISSEIKLYPRNVISRIRDEENSLHNAPIDLSNSKSDNEFSNNSPHQKIDSQQLTANLLQNKSTSECVVSLPSSCSNSDLSRHNAPNNSEPSKQATFSRFKQVDEDYDC